MTDRFLTDDTQNGLPPVFSLAVHRSDFLSVVGTGQAKVSDILGTIDLVGRICALENYQRAVFDFSGLEMDFTSTEHLAIGGHVAEALRPLERVASVVEARNHVGISEMAAQREGLALRTFTNLKEAIEWVARPTPAPAARKSADPGPSPSTA